MSVGDQPSPLSQQLRIAALIDGATVSGPARQLISTVGPLAQEGIAVRLLVFQRTGAPHTALRGFLEKADVDHVVVPFSGRFDRGVVRSVRDFMQAWQPDIVQTHHYRPTVIAWLLRRMGVNCRWIGFFHGATQEDLKARAYHWIDRQLLPSADRIVVMSRAQQREFNSADRKVVQLFNAVTPSPLHSQDANGASLASRLEELPHPRIGVVGRLSREKGVDVLLRAFARLRNVVPAANLVIAGDGPERASLELLAQRLGITGHVSFLGTVSPAELLYPLLDLVVLPSRSEGLPNVLLEALQADVPVVATRVGAVPEVLAGTDAGRIVEPEDELSLASAILTTLSEPPETNRASRASVVARFSLARRVRALVKLYREVLDSEAIIQARVNDGPKR